MLCAVSLFTLAGCQLMAFLLFRERSMLWSALYLVTAGLPGLWCRESGIGAGTCLAGPLAGCLLPLLTAGCGMLLSSHFLALKQGRPLLAPWVYGGCGVLVLAGAAGCVTGVECRVLCLGAAVAGPFSHGLLTVDAALLRPTRHLHVYASAWLLLGLTILVSGTGLHGCPAEDGLYSWGLVLHGWLLALALSLRQQVESKRRHHASLAREQAMQRAIAAIQVIYNTLYAMSLLARLQQVDSQHQRLLHISGWSARLIRALDQARDEMALAHSSLALDMGEFDLLAMTRQVLSEAVLLPSTSMLYGIVDPRLPARWVGDERRLQRLLTVLVERCLARSKAGSVALRLSSGGQTGKGSGLQIIIALGSPSAASSVLDTELQRWISVLGGSSGLRRNRGTELWLWLPLRPAAIQFPPPPLPAAPARILLAHPHRGCRHALASVLRWHGNEVDTAADEVEALEHMDAAQARHHRYDWLIIQPEEGDPHAERWLGRIRRHWPTSALRVVVLREPTRPLLVGCWPRPLLCNDAVALLRPVSGPGGSLAAVSPGLRAVVMAEHEPLRAALVGALAELGCRVGKDSMTRVAERVRLAPYRYGFVLDVVVLVAAPGLMAEVQQLRRQERGRRVSVLTVGGTVVERAAWRAAGADMTLPLPVVPEALAKALSSLAGFHRAGPARITSGGGPERPSVARAHCDPPWRG